MKNYSIASVLALALALALSGCNEGSTPAQTKIDGPAHDCSKGADIVIESDNSAFELTGICTQLSIKGAGNRLKIEAAKSIEIFGENNIVDVDAVDRLRAHSKGNIIRYKTAVTGTTSDVVTLGDNNTIQKIK